MPLSGRPASGSLSCDEQSTETCNVPIVFVAPRSACGEPSPPPKPRHDRVVLMADQYGKLSYVDDGGLVDVREVVNTHCERKERERAQW